MNEATMMIEKYEDMSYDYDSITECNEAFFEMLDDKAKHYLNDGYEFNDGSVLRFYGRNFVVEN